MRYKIARLEQLGYRWDVWVLDAADFGTPQHRARMFLIAVREGLPFPECPKPTHGPKGSLPYATLGDAIGWLTEEEAMNRGCAKLSQCRTRHLQLVPPGGNYKNLPEAIKLEVLETLHGKSPYNGLCGRLDYDIVHPTLRTGPQCRNRTFPIHPGYHLSDADLEDVRKSFTLLTKPARNLLVHPLITRCLSVQEYVLIMGLHKDFKVFGNKAAVADEYKQLGNGIPPQLMNAVCRAVAETLAGGTPGSPGIGSRGCGQIDHIDSDRAAKTPPDVRDLVLSDVQVSVEAASTKIIPGTPVVPQSVAVAKDIELSSPATMYLLPDASRLPGSEPSVVHDPRLTHFSHLYGLDSQISVLLSAIDACVRSGFTCRYHSVLYGPPGCGKTEVLKAVKSMLGAKNVLELDATATTAAGAENIFLENGDAPLFLLIEEIEKKEPAALRWLLGLLDTRAEIRKTNSRIGHVTKTVRTLCIATVNDMSSFNRLLSGALSSRFAHRIYCPRPKRQTLVRILEREIHGVGGDPAWIEPALKYCAEIEGTDDPRRVVAVCMSGRIALLTGEYQRQLAATLEPALVEVTV